jgi:hypothetical protein
LREPRCCAAGTCCGDYPSPPCDRRRSEHFFLFRDADTGADSVIYRRDDGRLAVIAPRDAPGAPGGDGPVRESSRYSGPLDLAGAISMMDALNHRFLYFTDASTGRGAVLYLRRSRRSRSAGTAPRTSWVCR